LGSRSRSNDVDKREYERTPKKAAVPKSDIAAEGLLETSVETASKLNKELEELENSDLTKGLEVS
jgi:hypothetical protein